MHNQDKNVNASVWKWKHILTTKLGYDTGFLQNKCNKPKKHAHVISWGNIQTEKLIIIDIKIYIYWKANRSYCKELKGLNWNVKIIKAIIIVQKFSF